MAPATLQGGQTALDWAASNMHTAVIAMLKADPRVGPATRAIYIQTETGVG